MQGKQAVTPETVSEANALRKAQRLAGDVGRGRPKGGNKQIRAFNEAVERGDVDDAYDELIRVAKDPDHKHWASAQKMLLERTANVTNFEKGGGASTPVINININSSEPVDVEIPIEGEVID